MLVSSDLFLYCFALVVLLLGYCVVLRCFVFCCCIRRFDLGITFVDVLAVLYCLGCFVAGSLLCCGVLLVCVAELVGCCIVSCLFCVCCFCFWCVFGASSY